MSPRAVMMEQLSAAMRAALDAGDVDAARVAHEAIGKLLGGEAGAGVAVIDLPNTRRRRDG